MSSPLDTDQHLTELNDNLCLPNHSKDIEKYSKLIEMDPLNPDYYLKRSNSYIELHQYENALDDCQYILVLDANKTEVFVLYMFFNKLKTFRASIY